MENPGRKTFQLFPDPEDLFQGLLLELIPKDSSIYQMFGLEFCEDPVHTTKCEILYFDSVLYASFYGGGIAPFIWTTINGCLKFWM